MPERFRLREEFRAVLDNNNSVQKLIHLFVDSTLVGLARRSTDDQADSSGQIGGQKAERSYS